MWLATRLSSQVITRIYSARSGTKAFKWAETVSDDEKGRRLQTIIALQEKHSAAINQALIGATTEVLVEGPARRHEGWLAGKTPQFKTAVFPANGASPGELTRVRIPAATAHRLGGGAACGQAQHAAPLPNVVSSCLARIL
jgi:tRNA A37 methylthiotransferase MiaB